MFAGATRTIAAAALAGAMVAGRVCYLHFAAIRGICKVDPCSSVHTCCARCGRCGCTFRKEILWKHILPAPRIWSLYIS